MSGYVRINKELKQELKVLAAKKNTTIKALAEGYIQEGMEKENLKGEGK